MDIILYWILCLKIIVSICVLLARCKDSVCVEFGNISQCSSSSTWAVNAYPLTVNHYIAYGSEETFAIYYSNAEPLDSADVFRCHFDWHIRYTNPACRPSKAECEHCIYNRSISTIKATLNISSDFFLTKNQFFLNYHFSWPYDWISIHNITVSECAKTVGSAVATTCSDGPCGYNCECQFKCPDGFIIDSADSSSTFKCNALAQWTPATPTCKPEPTGSDAPTTTPAETGMASGSNSSVCTPCLQKCGLGVTLPGAILLVLILGLTVYMGIKTKVDFGERIMFILYGAMALFVAVWVAAVCLCFKAQESHSSYVAGSVLGAASIVGLAVVTLLFLMQMRSSGDKAEEGNAEEMVPMSM